MTIPETDYDDEDSNEEELIVIEGVQYKVVYIESETDDDRYLMDNQGIIYDINRKKMFEIDE